ncbi:proline-rich protein 18 [Eleutherodactylus coqui]|uniref:proline-rich protein 18 n=1 Tax=Eleutherodactylus coqui TaxID=57060 RepID=UPI003462727E
MSLPPIPPHHRPQLGRPVERRASSHQPAMDQQDLANSWPSATLRRHRANTGQRGEPVHPVRRFLQQVPREVTRSYESVIHPRPSARREQPGEHRGSRAPPQEAAAPRQEAPLSLRLTPEAVLVIQKRSLERQRSAGARRVFASSGGRCPRSSVQRSPPDVRQLLKISLLNDQHRYDDMEYEDERWSRDGHDGLVRKCTEWLQGIELATGQGGSLRDKLQALPHLNTW